MATKAPPLAHEAGFGNDMTDEEQWHGIARMCDKLCELSQLIDALEVVIFATRTEADDKSLRAALALTRQIGTNARATLAVGDALYSRELEPEVAT
jgi:hypothetical protein